MCVFTGGEWGRDVASQGDGEVVRCEFQTGNFKVILTVGQSGHITCPGSHTKRNTFHQLKINLG